MITPLRVTLAILRRKNSSSVTSGGLASAPNVRKYVKGCALCQQMKSDTHPVTPPLVPIPSTTTIPFTFLLVDLITNLPPSGSFNSIMVVVDHGLSKGVIIIPCLKMM
jgi:hypothetical protein